MSVRKRSVKNLTSVSAGSLPRAKATLKSKLPALTPAEIRRYRIGYEDAVLMELEEDRAFGALEYLHFLFELDDELAKEDREKPKLRKNHVIVEELRKVLSIFAEESIPVECRVSALMETGLLLESLGVYWYWIAEVLYRTCFWVLACKSIKCDADHNAEDIRVLTLLQYVYAHFLYNNMKKAKVALEYVREAHQKAKNNKSWTKVNILKCLRERQCLQPRDYPSELPNQNDKSLYEDCYELLHQVLISICKLERHRDFELALGSARVALHAAIEADNWRFKAESLLELGKCERADRNPPEAVDQFLESLKIYTEHFDPVSICVLHSQLALAYKDMSDNETCLRHLRLFQETASKHKLLLKLAEAHYLIGEFYLTMANPREAVANLEFATSMYQRLEAVEELDRARCLIGIARGQIIMEAHRKLVMQVVEKKSDAVLRMIMWRDRSEPFC